MMWFFQLACKAWVWPGLRSLTFGSQTPSFEDLLARLSHPEARLPSSFDKLCKPAGKMISFNLCLKAPNKAKVCKPAGRVTSFNTRQLWLPWRVKDLKPTSKVEAAKLCLKLYPKTILWRPDGKVTPSMLWFNLVRKSNFGDLVEDSPWCSYFQEPHFGILWRPEGKVRPSMCWLKPPPKVKLWRPVGKVIASKLWLKLRPKAKLSRPFGKFTASKLSLKSKFNPADPGLGHLNLNYNMDGLTLPVGLKSQRLDDLPLPGLPLVWHLAWS